MLARIVSTCAVLAACGEVTEPVSAELPVVPTERGRHELAFLHDGVERTFIVYVPTSFDPTVPRPLVVALHGGGGTARALFKLHPFEAYGEETGYIFVAPQGTPDGKGGNEWNGSAAFDTGADDVGYLQRVVEGVTAQLAIDPSRRWMAGFSGGATMTVRFASERSELVAAIGTYAGKVGRAAGVTPPFLFPQPPATPLSVQMTYGSEDDNLAGEIQGGSLSTSAAEGMQWWADVLGCSATPAREVRGRLALDTYPACAAGSVVRMITVDGMGHAWPEKATEGIEGTKLLLDFFADKTKPPP